MYKRIKRKKLGRKKSHRESLIRNLLRSLFDHNYVVTTTVKAKALKQEASSLIEKGKKRGDDLYFTRELKLVLGKDEIINKYKEYLKKDKVGVGFVRVGFRDGDNSEMSRIYLLGLEKKKVSAKKSKKEDTKDKESKDQKEKKSPLKIQGETPIGLKKKVDKTAVIKKDERRPKARAGL